MTSKLVVNTIEADTGISSVSFASSISMNSTSKFHFSAAGVDIGADTNINRPAAGVLGFNINSSEKVRITSAGKVGIGTDMGGSPASNYGFGVYRASGTGYLYTETGQSGASAGLRAKAGTSDFTIFTTQGTGQLAVYDNTNSAERLRIDSSGNVTINTGNLTIPDSIIHSGDTNTKIRFPTDDQISMEVAGSEVFKIVPDAGHGSTQSLRMMVAHTVDGARVNMGGTKAYSGGIIRGMANIRDGNAYNVTDNGGGLGFSAIYNNGGSHTTMSQIEGVKANNTDGNYEGAIKFSTRHNLGNMVEKARIGLNGLSFQGDTAAANCLDDYEEGSWTPTARNQGSFTNSTGRYVKIGQQVTVWGFIPTVTNITSNDVLQCSGLPFSVGSSGHVEYVGTLMIRFVTTIAGVNGVSFNTYTYSGWDYVQFFGCRDDGNNYESIKHSDLHYNNSNGIRFCITYTV